MTLSLVISNRLEQVINMNQLSLFPQTKNVKYSARWIFFIGILLNSLVTQVYASSKSITSISTPVGTASNAPVTFFIPFEGYTGGKPASAIITDVETRGDFSWSGEYLDLRVSEK